MSDLDEKRLAVVIKALRDMGNDIFGHKEDAAAILAALDAYDAADGWDGVTEEIVNKAAGTYSLESRGSVYPDAMRAALLAIAPLLARRARAPMPAVVTEDYARAVAKGYCDARGLLWPDDTIVRSINAALNAALAAAPRDPQTPERHMTLGEQRTAMNALRRAGRPAEHVGIGMTDKSEPWHADLATRVKLAVLRGGEAHYVTRRRASAPPAALREVASTARTLARLSPANPALAKFAEAVARWAEGQQ